MRDCGLGLSALPHKWLSDDGWLLCFCGSSTRLRRSAAGRGPWLAVIKIRARYSFAEVRK